MTVLQDRGISVIDCGVNVSPGEGGLTMAYIPRAALRDGESLESYPEPAMVKYMFKGAEERVARSGDAPYVVGLLDEWGIERGHVIVTAEDAEAKIAALEAAGDRWFYSIRVNPHDGMKAVRALERVATTYPNVRSCAISPYATYPAIAPNSKEYYPLYAKCIELGLPVCLNVGVPGPRVPAWTQDPMHIDEVCWFFPDLTIVMKHGGEPWVDLCIKLMLKWPNLYYATSGFAPKYYPKEVLDYANTRGADRILYSGYWPMLSYDDIMGQVANLPLRDHVWQKMFSDNARRVFKLPASDAAAGR